MVKITMTKPLFKYGDKVLVDHGTRELTGTVISIYKDIYGAMVCRVKFDDTKMIPQEMEFPQSYVSHLKQRYKISGGSVNIETNCPKCGTKWHVMDSPIFGDKQVWRDCNNCNRTKEDIMEELNNEPQGYWD